MTLMEYREELTLEAIDNPMEGDLFTEMLSYWMSVESVDKNGVHLHHQPNNDSCKSFMTFDEFKQYAHYHDGKGSWLTLINRNHKEVSALFAEKHQQEQTLESFMEVPQEL